MERAELTKLLRATGCAEERGGFTFLCDPAWSAAERAKVAALQGSTIENRKSKIDSGWLCVPTGGTGGGVRFARHDERTLTAAVRGFCAHFGFRRVNAVGVLPPYHVSGLMARVRCAATGGRHVAWDWKRLESGDLPALQLRRAHWVLSLVPTQLQRLLAAREAVAWLRGFRAIFIGGGPVWPELTAAAARAELPLSLSYGLTETAAMVAAQRPAEFLAGEHNCGAVLPHARVTIDDEGRIRISGESVFRGYFPGENVAGEFATEDLGRLDERGHLHVLGRRDAVIIRGEKGAGRGGGGGVARQRRIRRCGGGGRAGPGVGARGGGVLCRGGPAAESGVGGLGSRRPCRVQAAETLCGRGGLAAQCAGQAEPRGAGGGSRQKLRGERWRVKGGARCP